MSKFFAIPDKERNYQSYMVFMLSILWAVVTGLTVSFGFFFFPAIWERWMTFLSVSLFIAVFNLSLNHFGHTRLASWSLVGMLWVYITLPCYSAGGMLAPGIISQVSIILTAGFLLGWKGGLAIGVLTMGADFVFAYLEIVGKLPEPTVLHTPMTRWIAAFIPFGTVLALQYYATNHLRDGLIALQHEVKKREDAEKLKDQTVHNLGERVKELKTLYTISRLLQREDASYDVLFQSIADVIPDGWQYPEITAARLKIADKIYQTDNFVESKYRQSAEMKTSKGTTLGIEVVYLQAMPDFEEGPFLKEERSLINMLVEMLEMDLERRERSSELKDYKYALDIATCVSVSEVDGSFSYVNANFCAISKYSEAELLGKDHSLLWSGFHSEDYFKAMSTAMQGGKPLRGEFKNRAKDGSYYWVDSSIVPFLDEQGKVYQYLSINHDITERKEVEEKIIQSELLLKKITSQVPGNTYMFEIEESGQSRIIFSNYGTDSLNYAANNESSPDQSDSAGKVLHPDDQQLFVDAMIQAYQTKSVINFQYRIISHDQIMWRWLQAVPEQSPDGRVIWYGATSDITPLVDYIVSIEQIIFDIGHIIRRPISSMIGITNLIMDKDLSFDEIKDAAGKLNLISEEMDKFMHELNRVYNQKRQETRLKIDFSALVDKRGSLFE